MNKIWTGVDFDYTQVEQINVNLFLDTYNANKIEICVN